MRVKGESFDIKNRSDLKTVLIRSLISALNGCVVAFFQLFLPLTVYYTLNASSIVFSFLLNYFLYKVPLSKNQIRSIVVSMVGVILVINGRYLSTFLDSSY